MNDPAQYGQITSGPYQAAEATSLSGTSQIPASIGGKRVSNACLACKKSKRKCSGVPPCDNCRSLNKECIFDESLDQRRRVAAKRMASELEYYRDVFNVFQSANLPDALNLLDLVRTNSSQKDIQAYVRDVLSRMGAVNPQSPNIEEAEQHPQDPRLAISFKGINPSFRRKVMDVHYLCGDAPFRMPARPWTTVTDDDDLVSHLVSLYFTWDYPFYALLDQEIFIKHMARQDLDSELCSPFLVNALLANACHYSEFSESYVVPGDVRTKGADFLAEARRLLEIEKEEVSLATLQGILLLHERYAMAEDDNLGYTILHRAVHIGTLLGLIGEGGPKIDPTSLSTDMLISMRRTAWGLYQLDTVVHACFMKGNLVKHVNLERFDREISAADDLWIPYPTSQAARPSYFSQYFDESCSICDIARDMSRIFTDEPSWGAEDDRGRARAELSKQLGRWYNRLPPTFDPSTTPPPHIILLRLRYYTLLISLYSSSSPNSMLNVPSEVVNSLNNEASSSQRAPQSPLEVPILAAREISALISLYQRAYGMERAHHFALYAINLALFVMLQQPFFNILDRDFISLFSAFSVTASHSALGHGLFHLFRQSVQAKGQIQQIQNSNVLPKELKELFDETRGMDIDSLGRTERYNRNQSNQSVHSQDSHVPGLREMLSQYENLSLGKDDFQLQVKQISH